MSFKHFIITLLIMMLFKVRSENELIELESESKILILVSKIDPPNCSDFPKADDYIKKNIMSLTAALNEWFGLILTKMIKRSNVAIDNIICGPWNEVISERFFIFRQDGVPSLFDTCPYVDGFKVLATRDCRGVYIPVVNWKPFNSFPRTSISVGSLLKLEKCEVPKVTGKLNDDTLRVIDLTVRMILQTTSKVIVDSLSIDETINSYLSLKCYLDSKLESKYNKWCEPPKPPKLESLVDVMSTYLTNKKLLIKVASWLIPYVSTVDGILQKINIKIKEYICSCQKNFPVFSRSLIKSLTEKMTLESFFKDFIFRSADKLILGKDEMSTIR